MNRARSFHKHRILVHGSLCGVDTSSFLPPNITFSSISEPYQTIPFLYHTTPYHTTLNHTIPYHIKPHHTIPHLAPSPSLHGYKTRRGASIDPPLWSHETRLRICFVPLLFASLRGEGEGRPNIHLLDGES